MKNKSQIISDARNIISDRRSTALNNYRDVVDEITDKMPELAAVKQELAACGTEMGILAIRGKLKSEEYDEIVKKMAALEKKRDNLFKNAGYPDDSLRPKFFCKTCEDNGYVKDADGNEQTCSCLKKEIGRLFIENSNLPVKSGFEAHNPDLFCDEDREKMRRRIDSAKASVEKFPEQSKRLVLGKSGVGKTFFASMLGTELAGSGKNVIYITLPELMRTLLYFGEDEILAEERDHLAKLLKNADVLILDELGTEKMSEAKQDLLADIIDTRYQDKTKGLIVVTNSTLREILSNYGERIFSRLTSKEVIIDNIELADGKDLRRK